MEKQEVEWMESEEPWTMDDQPSWMESEHRSTKKDHTIKKAKDEAWVTESKKNAKKVGTLADIAKIHQDLFTKTKVCGICGLVHGDC